MVLFVFSGLGTSSVPSRASLLQLREGCWETPGPWTFPSLIPSQLSGQSFPREQARLPGGRAGAGVG